MTDSTRSHEIEDVLSSIRRLVADERPLPLRLGAREAVRNDAAGAGDRGPLLLTESLRVVSSAPPAAEAPATVAETATAAATATATAAVASVGVAAATPAPAQEGLRTRGRERDERDLRALFAVAARNVAQVGEAAPMAEWEEEDPDTVCDVTPLPFVTRRRAPGVMPPAGSPQPDAAGRDEARDRPPPGGTAAGEAAPDAAATVATGAGAKGNAGARRAPGVLPDHDLLRELVREILLEELSGSLGERITRNLRRLARAEANRAVATRDLG